MLILFECVSFINNLSDLILIDKISYLFRHLNFIYFILFDRHTQKIKS